MWQFALVAAMRRRSLSRWDVLRPLLMRYSRMSWPGVNVCSCLSGSGTVRLV
jgi:hypothetical protein